MNDRIIWYKTFYNPIEANIIRAKLEDSGFHCFLKDENISTLQPLYNQAYGGVKLMVFERDTAQIDLLLSDESGLEKINEQFPGDKSEGKIVCEKCGSKNVAYGQAIKGRFSWWVILVSLLLTVYPFKANKRFHCYDCGHEFP
jgi:hypothetical protein